MPYNTSNYQPNGMHNQQNTPKHLGDLKATSQQQYPAGQKPQIYTVWLPIVVQIFRILQANISHDQGRLFRYLSL